MDQTSILCILRENATSFFSYNPNMAYLSKALNTALIHLSDFIGISGAPGRTRTADPLITNQVLYQLSYKGTWAGLS
jgi:hypothetical protein